MIKPIISIVIGSYNRRPFLESTIESIRHNNISVPYEIIVIDGGSDDGSIEYLIEQKDIISIIQHNRGEWQGKPIDRKSWGYFLNIAFKAGHGKYILMTSDDTLLLPNCVMNGYNLFEKLLKEGKKIGAMAFYFRNYPGETQYSVYLTYGNTIFVNHGIYLKSALEEINYIDEDNYFFYCGDSDVCLRLKERGYEIIDAKSCFVEHFKHASGSSVVTHSEKHKKSMEYFHNKWGHLENTHGKQIFIDHEDDSDTAKAFRKKLAYLKYRLYVILLGFKKRFKK